MSSDSTGETRLIGQVTGGYRVLARIGSGTMGHVYEAEDASSGKRVALKVLHKNHQKELAARFLREGKTLALLSHPNIVQLVDMGQLDEGTLFLATELIPGGSLRAVMDRGPIEARRALVMVRQLLDALGAAHELGIVHRDIKPENVMVADGDVIKVLDFGVAKLLADTVAGLGEANLTSVGFSIFGSALYIAPESVTGQPVDARIDLYSTGAMLFEMLTGRPPFDHEDPAVLLRQHAFDPPPTLQQVAPATPFGPTIEALVARALAKQPDDRFRSAADMMVAIDAAVQALEWQPPADVSATDERRARTVLVRPSNGKKLAIGSGIAAVLLGAVVVFASRGGDGIPANQPSAGGSVAARASELLRAGHARFALGEHQPALAAYERALRASPAVGADITLRSNLLKVLDGKDSLASVLTVDLLSALTPPELDAIVDYASKGKLADARHRAIMVAEREGVGEKVDRVQSWTLDLQQGSACDERKATIELLARTSDRRAIVALKRMRTVKCVEREASDAIARIESAASAR